MTSKRFWAASARWWILPPIVVGIAAVVFFKLTEEPIPRQDSANSLPKLPAIQLQPSSFRPQVVGFGTAEPIRTWTAIAEVRGTIAEIHPRLKSGNLISEDDLHPLVGLDDTDYQLQVGQRQADLDAAQAKLAELEASAKADTKSLAIERDLLQLRQSEVQRLERLQASRSISESELDQTRSVYFQQRQAVQRLENSLDLYPSRIAAAQASVALAESQLKTARRDLERTKIQAPFSGLLSGVDLQVGQVVNQGQSLFRMLDTSTVEVTAQFTLAQVRQLFPSQNLPRRRPTDPARPFPEDVRAVVVSRSGDVTFEYPGRPVRLSERIDDRTRTLTVVIEVENSSADESTTSGQPWLRPGTFCEVRLEGPVVAAGLVVPSTAVVGGHAWVAVPQDAHYRLQAVTVQPEAYAEDRVLVTNGLEIGQWLIVQPSPAWEPDTLVEIEALDWPATPVGDAAGELP